MSPKVAPQPEQVAPQEDCRCPLCEYDLRGLNDSRCPECGYSFTWDELRDPTRRFHPYLFEHHPRRNGWSFLRTLTMGLLPRRFWSTLYPTQPSRPARLVAYWALCGLPLFVAAAAYAWLMVYNLLTAMRGWLAQPWNRVEPHQVAIWAVYWDIHGGGLVLISFACLAWPWLTLGALMVFQVSLRRARLRSSHVLRCVLYSGDVCFWCAAPLALVVLFAWAGQRWPPRSYLDLPALVLPAVLLLWMSYRLWTAYRLYLRFHHALATILASQAIVVLVYVKLWYTVRGL